jgi:hypothetical protein
VWERSLIRSKHPSDYKKEPKLQKFNKNLQQQNRKNLRKSPKSSEKRNFTNYGRNGGIWTKKQNSSKSGMVGTSAFNKFNGAKKQNVVKAKAMTNFSSAIMMALPLRWYYKYTPQAYAAVQNIWFAPSPLSQSYPIARSQKQVLITS